MEYCRYGSLESVIRRKRDFYRDLCDKKGDYRNKLTLGFNEKHQLE